jgi:hypothetical protein
MAFIGRSPGELTVQELLQMLLVALATAVVLLGVVAKAVVMMCGLLLSKSVMIIAVAVAALPVCPVTTCFTAHELVSRNWKVTATATAMVMVALRLRETKLEEAGGAKETKKTMEGKKLW